MEVGALDYPTLHVPTQQGAKRSNEPTEATAYAIARKIHSVCLTNNSGIALYLALIKGTTIPEEAADLDALDKIVIATSETGEQPLCVDFGSSGYPVPAGFVVLLLLAPTGTVQHADLTNYDGTHCAVAYS